MSNDVSASWQCPRCGTRNLGTAALCARCGRPRGTASAGGGSPARGRAAGRRRPRETGSPGFAAVLSALLPGLGQVYEDRWVRGILLLILPLFVFTLTGAFVAYADPLTSLVLRNAPLVTFLVVGSALAFHLYVVGDAFAGRMRSLRGRHLIDYAVLGLITLALIGGYTTLYRQSSPWASLAARLFAPFGSSHVTLGPGGAPPPDWSGSDRLNVLVLGIDTREGDKTDQNTDTMLILSLDPLNRTASMLSLPRDIYIDRPGTFQGKINAAYAFGGPPLVRRVVGDLLGIPIHSYALVNFEAFNKIIDGVGGVIVDAKRPVRDESYPTPDYGVERINIVAGPQLMHGDVALKYARSRHDSNDYSRAKRQQEVVGALRDRLAQPEALRSIPSLIDSVGTALETDFDPANVLPLARTGTGIDSADIRSEVLYPCGGDYPHCELASNSDNGFYLFPDARKVLDFAAQLFYDPKVRQEGARVEVQNSGARAGTARGVADRLALRAYGIADVTDGAAAKSAVVLRNGSKRYTAEQLRHVLGDIPIETASAGSGPDIVVRIGSDFRGFATDLTR
ncbi:MAG TPA: LCP family protein [Candidatus Limnocylindria bacterium]|nr:LCP family protein [Candidatus Limnocylindria bacterium]